MNEQVTWRDRLMPFLAWPAQWRALGVQGDILAGITVGLVLVPQAMAYAQLASLPPHIGLYAALLPTIIGALFGSCGAIATGPVALTSLLTGASLIAVARPGTEGFVEAAIVLALLSGVIQLALGGLRLGWLLKLLSRPVMTGFISASALLIALSQVPALFGLKMLRSEHFMLDFLTMLATFTHAHLPALAFGLATLATLVIMRRFTPKLPSVLVVVVIATLISAVTGFEAGGGSVVGHIPAGLPDLVLPRPDWNLVITLLPAAFVIALVSFMEVTASASVISARTGERWRQNQELIGQGLAKMASAFSGGMPVSGSFSRSALNFSSGARTGLSSLIAAVFVLVTLLFLTPLLWHLPIAVLAAVIMLVVFNLFDPKAFPRAWQASRDDGIAATATFISTLIFAPNIQNGILVGLLVSLSLMLYRDMQPRVALLGLHPDGTYRDLKRFELAHPHPNLVIMRFDSALTFVTAEWFEDTANEALRAQRDVRTLLVSAAGINNIDATGLHTISMLAERLAAKNHTLAFCGLKKQAIDAMENTGLWQRLEPHAHYRTEQHALEVLLQELPPAEPDPQASG
ncbi:MAG TPA: SulP family inorganic anion transporter [Azoarcus sp.]|nr:SulP family inorganic anion transporter [Azoarcus sp.]